MQASKIVISLRQQAGFTLPAILMIVAALLILAVGALLVVGLEHHTARAFVERQKASLAVHAGLAEVKGIFQTETSNDDYFIIQAHAETQATSSPKRPPPYLYLVRGKVENQAVDYRYLPLFSSQISPPQASAGGRLTAPPPQDFVGENPKELHALARWDAAQVSWLPIMDDQQRMVSRYAYWIEDLQSRVDAGTAGNNHHSGSHQRYGWQAGDSTEIAKFPAPGLNPRESKIVPDGADLEPPLNQVALYAIDPASLTAADQSAVDDQIIRGRKALISPDSVVAVAGISPPLTRGPDGHLTNLTADAVEECLTSQVRPYDEQPLVPYAFGIHPAQAGLPKLNLNALLAKAPTVAVTEMADWIHVCLPTFEARKGGFPDHYLKTLAANALDYADIDAAATLSEGITQGPQAYRGLDNYPLVSEICFHIKYKKAAKINGRQVLIWQILVFVELWNHCNVEVTGSARVSYEHKMCLPAIGTGTSALTFDSPALLEDRKQVQHSLTKIGDYYWSAPFPVVLAPNQYKFYKAATVNYLIDVGSPSMVLQSKFEIYELGGASGMSLMWNDQQVDRSARLARGNTNPLKSQLEFDTYIESQVGKANIPGHTYGYYNTRTPTEYRNNMGDSRQALYLRSEEFPLADISYPGNVSPNLRNFRNATVYHSGARHAAVYGRVLPSEWPDGGHDVAVTGFPVMVPPENDFDPTDLTLYPDVKNGLEGDTPTFLSNRGRFYSATELGRIYDPLMYLPTYQSAVSSEAIINGMLPAAEDSWPAVEVGSPASALYGGGNTLRIGRPEHPKFDQPPAHVAAQTPGNHAARLLDIFHAGKSRSATAAEREGPVVRIEGHVNINTAAEGALRALAAGWLVADPRLSKRTAETGHSATTFAPAVTPLQVSVATKTREADVVAQAIIRGRPYASAAEIVSAVTADGEAVFGNRELLPDGKKVQWSDAAAEEGFARVYEAATVRSRNFRVWVIGQAVAATGPDNPTPEVLSEVRKVFTVFADPGERQGDGKIDPAKFRVQILHENEF